MCWVLPAVLSAVVPMACKKSSPPPAAEPANFHVLDAGRAYRSAQPTGEPLRAVIDTYGIRTVIDLRGPNPGQGWYDAEAAVCAAKGVKLSDHRMRRAVAALGRGAGRRAQDVADG